MLLVLLLVVLGLLVYFYLLLTRPPQLAQAPAAKGVTPVFAIYAADLDRYADRHAILRVRTQLLARSFSPRFSFQCFSCQPRQAS